ARQPLFSAGELRPVERHSISHWGAQFYAPKWLLPLQGRPRVYCRVTDPPVGQAGRGGGRSSAQGCRLTGCTIPRRSSRAGATDPPGIHGALWLLGTDARTPAPRRPGRTVVDRG